jgi:ABC-type multidrug transport system ATPase subunit/GT2 family glycosyltransferase
MGAWQEHLVDFWLALELLDQEPEIVERAGAVELPRVEGRITFEGACFSYPNRVDTLRDISFDVAAGSVVAIVGPTGAGKSTLTNLVPRFYEVGAGRVLLDGHDVRDLTLDSLRLNVAMVQQEPMLFLATIAENIRYGRLEASMDEVVAAAKQANAHDFIMALPDRYDTRLGERGSMLSGGERQRICIARAFLKDAPVLILDEPTSSIDSRTERVILDALERLMVGRTTFIVAHRLSTIRRADTILVLDGGRLVEQGTHEQLLAADGGLYRQLWTAQTGGRTQDLETPKLAVQAAVAPASVAAPAVAARPKAVVLGMMTKMPVAGAVWQTVHYLVGLERLGFDAYYVEAHARTPSMLMTHDDDDSTALAGAFIERVMRRFGLEQRWAFHALHDDGRCLGMSAGELARLYESAAVILNLHGGTEPRPEHAAGGKLVYVESDPCQLQVELDEGLQRTIDFLEPHAAFFTFGENLGRPGCSLPVSDRFPFVPTRQPVLVDLWEARGITARQTFTTVANWRQAWRELQFEGETYTWSKHHEFLKILDLPRRSDAAFELALSSYEDADRDLLETNGWLVRPALDVSRNIDTYRAYVAGSMGELTVAKDQNVRFRSGWFSDRSATYLAAGRPVVTQDTGFGDVLPTGTGLFPFSSIDEAADAVETIRGDYARQSRGARTIARECFDANVVLGDMLHHLGLRRVRRGRPRAVPIPDDLVLTPESRRPLVLPEATRATVLARPVGAPVSGDTTPTVASVVVVTYDNLVCTRLCLESVLGADGPAVEVIAVDNGSTDGTPAYLERLAASDPRVRVVANVANRGFATAVNQGLAAARCEHLVILNNDVVVAPGWLEGLLRHFDDPTVGAVGPVTGRIGNEAEIEVDYDTYGAFRQLAADRATRFERRSFEIPMLALFCTVVSRQAFAAIGPLDEGYGLGLFEDDDYAQRLRAAGYRLLCAEDVYVHHTGEATFGNLVASGEYGSLFEQNRGRYEAKWHTIWKPHARRRDPAYAEMVARIRLRARAALPLDANALVISRGDADLLDIGCRASHFPQTADGQWAGHNPGTSEEAIAHLALLEAAGATHLLVPATAEWWLDHYTELAAHLRRNAAIVSVDRDCLILDLGAAAGSRRADHLETSAR